MARLAFRQRDKRAIDQTCDALNDIDIRHDYADDGTVWRGGSCGEEGAFALKNSNEPVKVLLSYAAICDRSAIGVNRTGATAGLRSPTGRSTISSATTTPRSPRDESGCSQK